MMIDVINYNYINRRINTLSSDDEYARYLIGQDAIQIIEMVADQSLTATTNLYLQSDTYSDNTGYSNTTDAPGAATTATFSGDKYIRNADADNTEYVNINISLTGTITHTMLVVRDADRESGDDILYSVVGSGGTTADLELDTKNKNIVGTITDVKIQLVSGTSHTAGKPAVKTYCLVVWKS